jgi:glutathione peroxidase
MGSALLTLALLLAVAPVRWADAACPEVLGHTMRKLRSDGQINLCEQFSGKPLLIVNTASHCGFTPQLRGLESLHQRYRDRGLAVIGVPSNSFRQAARDEETAARICYVNYGVTFTMLAEVEVRGPRAHPLFKLLARQAGEPSWNFNKYLVDREGRTVSRFDSTIEPLSPELLDAIESKL